MLLAGAAAARGAEPGKQEDDESEPGLDPELPAHAADVRSLRRHDRVYVSWTRFIFNRVDGSYVQSPIFFAYSSDHGATFSAPTSISRESPLRRGLAPVGHRHSGRRPASVFRR